MLDAKEKKIKLKIVRNLFLRSWAISKKGNFRFGRVLSSVLNSVEYT